MLTQDRIWGEVPPGFKKVTEVDGSRLVVRTDQEGSITVRLCRESAGLDEAGRFYGRAELRTLRLQNGETALIRAYRHGGALRRITGGLFFTWPPRPFRELSITEELRRRGIPTVEVYGACMEAVVGPLYRGWLVTRELRGAQDLWAAFQSGLIRDLGVESSLRAVAKCLRSLHQEGVFHSDLNLKNLLVRREPDGVKGYIIDFDKAMLVLGNLPPELAKRNLDRLLRSVKKLDPDRKYFSPGYWNEFIQFYHEGDGREV